MINYKKINFSRRLSEIKIVNGVSTWIPLNISISEKDFTEILKEQKELLKNQLKEIEIEKKQIIALTNSCSLASFNIGYDPKKTEELQKGINLINQMIYGGIKNFFDFKEKKLSSDHIKDFLIAKVSIPNFILGIDTLYIE